MNEKKMPRIIVSIELGFDTLADWNSFNTDWESSIIDECRAYGYVRKAVANITQIGAEVVEMEGNTDASLFEPGAPAMTNEPETSAPQWEKRFNPLFGMFDIVSVPGEKTIAMGMFDKDADMLIAQQQEIAALKLDNERLRLALEGGNSLLLKVQKLVDSGEWNFNEDAFVHSHLKDWLKRATVLLSPTLTEMQEEVK